MELISGAMRDFGTMVPIFQGKKVEALIWTAGIPFYNQMYEESAEKGYDGFTFACP
jgi:hypothetical protein